MRILLMCLVLYSSFAQAQWVSVEGRAVLEEGKEALSKHKAIKDALKTATMVAGVKISSHSRIENHQLKSESGLIHHSGIVKDYKVVDSYQEEGFIYVAVKALIVEGENQCPGYLETAYRKKTVLLPFVIDDHQGVSDLRGASEGLTLMLERELRQSNRLEIETVSLSGAQVLNPEAAEVTIQEIATRFNAQFVVVGVLRQASPRHEVNEWQRKWDAFEGDFYSNPSNARTIDQELFIYDGFSGQLLSQKQYAQHLQGDVEVGRSIQFGSRAFTLTLTGAEFQKQILMMSDDVISDTECQPFVTTVADVRDGQIFIASGRQSGLQVGDELMIYSQDGLPVNLNGQSLGIHETLQGVIQIDSVQAGFSVATTPDQRVRVRIGDIVRSW